MQRKNNLLNKRTWQILWFATLSSIAMQLGNIGDAFFSGRLLGTDVLAVVSLGINVDTITELPGIILGAGGNALAAILLGKRKQNDASSVFSMTLLIGLIFGAFFMAMSPFSKIFAQWIAGDEQKLIPELTRFIRCTLLGAPIFCVCLQLNVYAALDNHDKLCTIYIVTANIVKFISEYFMLKFCNGNAGSIALSTYIGYGAGMLVFIKYFTSDSRMLKLVNPFQNRKSISKELFPYIKLNLVEEIGSMLCAFILSIYLIRAGGTVAVTLYAIGSTIGSLFFLIAGGALKVVPIACGVLYSERDYIGLKNLIKKVFGIVYTLSGLLIIFLCVFPDRILQNLGIAPGSGTPIFYITVYVYAGSILLDALYFLTTKYYKSIGQNKHASALYICNSFIFMLPLLLGLSQLFVALGLEFYYGILAGSVLTTVFSLAVVFLRIRKESRSLWMLPKETSNVLDITVSDIMSELDSLIDTILDFCATQSIDKNIATLIAVAAEEACISIKDANNGNHGYIDVLLRTTPTHIVMKLRSDGIPFDPTSYIPKEKEASSLFMLQKLASNIQYMRIMGLNSTILTFDKEKNLP